MKDLKNGQMCVAKFYHRWNRARVVRMLNDGSVKVKIDFSFRMSDMIAKTFSADLLPRLWHRFQGWFDGYSTHCRRVSGFAEPGKSRVSGPRSISWARMVSGCCHGVPVNGAESNTLCEGN